MNLYKPETRPIWEIEALTAHESVPGHHLQIALSYELTGLPEFRRNADYTAFIEGWALYCESLGYDLGLYKDDFSKIGQLNYDMWRAVRLVVDTGMHQFKWTRDQAIYYFKQNTGKSDQDIENEVDRYISWPGQALAYKLGQLRIQALRAEAEKALGDALRYPRIPRPAPRNGRVALVGAGSGNACLDRGAERAPVVVESAAHQAFSSRLFQRVDGAAAAVRCGSPLRRAGGWRGRAGMRGCHRASRAVRSRNATRDSGAAGRGVVTLQLFELFVERAFGDIDVIRGTRVGT